MIAEIDMAIVLLIRRQIAVRSLPGCITSIRGFRCHNVLTMDTSLGGSHFEKTAVIAEMTKRTVERLEGLPGVESAAATSYLPLVGGLGLGFVIEGRPAKDPQSQGGAGWAYVTPDFFNTFKLAIKRGRGFTERDDAGAPGVAIINEAMARRFWAHQNPLGRRVTIGGGMGPDFAEPPREIISMVSGARDGGLNQDPFNEMFVPLAQVRDGVMALNNRFMPLSWVVRTKTAPLALSEPVQRVFHEIADLPVGHVREHGPGGGAINGPRSVQHRPAEYLCLGCLPAGIAGALRDHRLFGSAAHAGVWNPRGAGGGCSVNVQNGGGAGDEAGRGGNHYWCGCRLWTYALDEDAAIRC